jgi:ankyrin repeat protein
MKRTVLLLLLLVLAPVSALAAAAEQTDPGARLREAASRGDLGEVRALLDAGTDVNAKSEYGATALSYASDKGQLEVVKLLLARGAEVDPADTFYQSTPITWAGYNGHVEVVKALIEAGANPTPAVMMALSRDKPEVVRVVAASGKVPLESLSGALAMARASGKPEIVKVLEEAGVKPPPPATAEVDPALLATYAGRYSGDQGMYLAIVLADEKTLQLNFMEQPPLVLGAVDATRFRPKAFDALTLTFRTEEGRVTGVTLDQAGTVMEFTRAQEPETAPAAEPASASPPGASR